MKRITLILEIFPRDLKIDPTIHGNIQDVLDMLAEKVSEENALVDLSGLRGLPITGKFVMCTYEGDLDNFQVLDFMKDHQGTVVLRPGEYLSFEFEGDFVLVYNKPKIPGEAYVYSIISERHLDLKVAEELRELRSELAA